MLPAILLMIFAQEVLENMGKSNGFYIVFSVLTLIAMYILLSIEYDKLYNTTYQESADLRIRTAENLSKLPLSYFSKHDISDISQTIMADIEGIEHAMSHSIQRWAAWYCFPINICNDAVGHCQDGFICNYSIYFKLYIYTFI